MYEDYIWFCINIEMINYFIEEFWGILGVLVSVTGLLIAIVQLRKIVSQTKIIDETYKKTISDLENRDAISNLSTALQKIEIIKTKIIENKIDGLLLDLAPLTKLLVTLQTSLQGKIDINLLEKHKQIFVELEIKIIIRDENIKSNSLKEELIILSELELKLSELQSNLRYNKDK